jgi:hypothetical protein
MLVTASLGYNLFTENLDSNWTPNAPPAGWRIFHSDTLNVGDDDWHRDSARAPWTGHPTAFAAILPSVTPDSTPDSLISPVIDCRGYGNVTLQCSTDFLPATVNPYTAQVIYSIDGGATYPYVAQSYSAATGTVLETLVLDQARDQANVVIAWVFYGDLNDITSWYVDDIVVTGDSLYLWDIQAGPIVMPGGAVIRTGTFTPACRFGNVGDTIQRAIPVACSLYTDLGVGLAGWTAVIDSLWSGWPETVAVFTPAYALTPGDYSVRFWCYADSDLSRANDTVAANFTAVDLYDMATTAIVAPGATVLPGNLSPAARFRNLGDTIQPLVPVACTLYDSAMNVVTNWTTTIGPVSPAAETLVTFSPPYSLAPGDYFIRFWCSADSDYQRANDTLSIAFQATNLYDMATTAIVSPGASMWPGNLSPAARFRNLGDTIQTVVPVACTLYDSLLNVVTSWSATIGPVTPAAETLVTFAPPYFVASGNYYISFNCSADSDYQRGNDTLGRSFAVSATSGPLLSENFDGTWNTGSPPPGWRITHTGAVGSDDWHRENANFPPWGSHPSPFAAIYYGVGPDASPDSLISPTIDCSGCRNITLACSTFFVRFSGISYRAQIRYSIDGGATFPFLLRDYYAGSSSSPVLETFRLDSATNQSQVQLAWIFDGNLANITCWYLDDVSVTGESIPAWDIECRRIVSPATRMLPGPMSPIARFKNSGANDQYNVAVACSLYDAAMNPLQGWTDVIDTLLASSGEKDTFFSPAYDLTDGDYYIKVWAAADSDYNRTNDTLDRYFTVSNTVELGYDQGAAAEYSQWPVGHYGWGVRLTPDTFPVYLESARVYLAMPSNPNHCRYQLAVFGEDAGGPGEMWFKTPVLNGTPGDTGWQSVFLADSGEKIVLDSGSFYLFYLQVGEPPECPAIGKDDSRSPLADYWQYRAGAFRRDSSGGDFKLRMYVNLSPVTPPNSDIRTMFVGWPWYEFVQRPWDAPVRPKARIENFGTTDFNDFSATCSIIGPGGGTYYTDRVDVALLNAGADTVVDFAPWVPAAAERCSVIVHVLSMIGLPDDIPENDDKRFDVTIVKGAHTGSSALNYGFIDSDTTGGPVFNWIDTSGFGIAPNLGNEDRINIPTFFDFRFYDSTYNYVYASANGWLAMGSSNPGGTGDSLPRILPNTDLPNRAIYPFWDNLAMGPGFGGGHLYYKTLGSYPNRYFVLTWLNVNRVGTDTTNGLSFQVVVRENGTFDVQYNDVTVGDPAHDYGRGISVGLDGPDGTDGLGYLYSRPPMSAALNDPGNRLNSGRAIRFFRVYRDAAALEIVQPEFYAFPGTIVPEAKVQNYGTVPDSIRVFLNIGASYYAETLLTSVPAGESTLVRFPPWNAQLGSFTAVCSTKMVGDSDSTNNVTSKLIIVSPWVQREDIPKGWRRRKVKEGTAAYVPTTERVYVLKGSNTNELWTYDIATRTWDTLAPMPLSPSGRKARDGADLTYDPDRGALGRLWAIKGGGRPDFYYYDIATNTWTEAAQAIVIDSVEGRNYRPPKKGASVAYAQNMVYCVPGNRTNYFWKYDIAGNRWSYVSDANNRPVDVPSDPLRFVKCKFGTDMVYGGNDTLYVLKGSNSLEAYGYDLNVKAWIDTLPKVSLLGLRSKTVKSGASMAFYDHTVYVLKGGNTQEFWSYQVGADSWLQRADIPISISGKRTKVKRGSAMTAAESTIYCLKGSYGYEFWEYKPGADQFVIAGYATRPERSGVMEEARVPQVGPWLSVYPNPSRATVSIAFNLPAANDARIRIYDAVGRQVASLGDRHFLDGRGQVQWQRVDRLGRRVAAGVYFVEMTGGDVKLTRKVIIKD